MAAINSVVATGRRMNGRDGFMRWVRVQARWPASRTVFRRVRGGLTWWCGLSWRGLTRLTGWRGLVGRPPCLPAALPLVLALILTPTLAGWGNRDQSAVAQAVGPIGRVEALTLPAVELATIEHAGSHADVARANISRAGLADLVEVRVGKALDTLPTIAAEKAGPFDLIFIDADKANIPDYFAWSLKLSRKGSLIVVDNVVRKGNVIDADSTDLDVQGVRRQRRGWRPGSCAVRAASSRASVRRSRRAARAF